MVSESSRKREEDEMLRYAHVERSVEKHYAFRYKGYVDEVPYFFLRNCLDKRVRDFREEIEFRELEERWIARQYQVSDDWRKVTDALPRSRNQICRDGDWIVIVTDQTVVLSDEAFRLLYKPVADLSY